MRSATTTRWRATSLTLGALSVLLPVMFLAALRAGLLQRDGEFCGMPALGVVLLAYLLCFVLSALAVATGVAGYRRLAVPRPRWRGLELGLVGLPGLAMLGMALTVAIPE